MLDLLRGFDLDAVLTSDHEWCTYAELDGIAIHQLLTDEVDKAVTTARFIWTGTAGTLTREWRCELWHSTPLTGRPVG